VPVVAAYIIFVPIAALCFWRLPLRTALLLVLIGGWWLLPVGRYDPGAAGTSFPWWIPGIALPSDMLLTKAWVPPVVAFAGAALKDSKTLRRWRPQAIDLPMLGWCLWPFVQGMWVSADPPAWLATLYVMGSWGLPWLIGRLWLSGPESALALTRALALSGLANLPVAVIEGMRSPMLYGLVYGPHPFRHDGVARYIGYRPIGFLEHGTLYGLWAALAAFAAVWLACQERGADHRRWVALAILNVIVALASQSTGAIILLVIGLALLAMWRSGVFVPAMGIAGALLLVVAAVHLSGVVPVESIGRSPAGERVIAGMRAIGRGSFLWRVSQDAKTLGGAMAHPVRGTGQWDWWRPYHTRPWGQPLLLIGQYGLAGLMLAWGALLAAAAAAFLSLRQRGAGWRDDAALPLGIIVLLAIADAGLNAFFFAPAILAAGAVAGTPRRSREECAPAETNG
jgi:hypothetical protein